MDMITLTQALRDLIPSGLNWSFVLYGTHKSRDGLELDFGLCKMADIPEWVETVCVNLLEKTLADRSAEAYSPFLPKEVIGVLPRTDPMIQEKLGDIIRSIGNGFSYAPEDYISGVAPKPAGYAFYGYSRDEEGKIDREALIIRRSNPFLTGQRIRLCTTVGNEIVGSEKPLLKFLPSADFIMIGDVCYFLSHAVERDFELENRHTAICAKRLLLVADASVISDYEQFEQTAMQLKNAKKFVDFEPAILEHIARLPAVERIDFLSTYGITTDEGGRMDTKDPEQCELIVDLLCARSCLDAMGRLAVGERITPR